MRRRAILGTGAGGVAALGLTLLAGWWQIDGPGAPDAIGDPLPLPLTAMNFDLVDHEGRAVGPQTLIGRPTMLFFGFTWCPDVCPTTLADISGWLNDLGDAARDMNVVLVSVDPERDTPEVLAEYVGYFHPAIRGWTGPPQEVSRALGGFGARAEKVPTGDGDYTMNHTAGVFLFDAAGRFASVIDYHEPREFAVPKIRRALRRNTEGQI